VDASIEVTRLLQKKLKDSYITKPAIYINNKNGQNLKIQGHKKKLIFIAGMGGKEIQGILHSLAPQLSPYDSLVISPHRKILELRHYLHSSSFQLKREMCLFENKQFYQIIHLSLLGNRPVSFFGEDIWKSEIGERYRLHQINHFIQHRDPRSQDYVSYLKKLSS
jgi:tRNA (adenine22-N1)-methyltransferase